ncbi:MAG: type I restriction-modification system subunit M [Chloroflexi bacterium]|nr:type I restriction-modification system subunit M [Chloroflexota bacterium]
MIATNFFSSGVRQKVDQLMDILWAGGVNNPMDSIEQLSYLIFLRLLSEQDELLASLDRKYKRIFSGDWARYAWGNFVTLTGDQLFDAARSAIEKLHDLPGMSETGQLLFNRATLKIYDRPTLRAAIQTIHAMDLSDQEGLDVKGDMYEYLLSRIATSGTNGQFRTPRHIIDMIVKLVDPQPHWRICDPAVGTAGFLVAAYRHILRTHTSKRDLERGAATGDLLKPRDWTFLEERAFTGFDNDANMVKFAIMNLYLHRLEKANIQFFNPLTTSLQGSYPGEQFDCVVANPPFAGKIQKESILADINLDTRNTELLFLKWFIDHLAPRGRAGVIVPNGVLFGSTKSARKVRGLVLSECQLQAVINLPSGCFKPYSGVGTAVLIFEKRARPIWLAMGNGEGENSTSALPFGESGGEGEFVWFYDLTADGFSLDDKRTPISANDIPDVLAKWPGREEGPNSYRVALADIVANDDLSLAAGRYRAAKVESVQHDDPREILREVNTIEHEIAIKVRALLDGLQ